MLACASIQDDIELWFFRVSLGPSIRRRIDLRDIDVQGVDI
jgi:hypothetical protein